mgnify:CR=1 FL=1|jgi:hypothetical protein
MTKRKSVPVTDNQPMENQSRNKIVYVKYFNDVKNVDPIPYRDVTRPFTMENPK